MNGLLGRPGTLPAFFKFLGRAVNTPARRRRLTLAFLATVFTAAHPSGQAWAQGIDLTQGGPIHITAQDGIEWRQAEQIVIAKGDAKAVRGTVTVTADRLIAWYRRKGETTPAQQVAIGQTGAGQTGAGQVGAGQTGTGQQPAAGLTGAADTEGNEVYRLRAEGNVHVFTPTDQAWGDQATDDLDQAVLVLTGHNLKLATPDDTLTARDTLEYWSRKHMAVARGDAIVLTNDARRISADTLVAYTVEPPASGSVQAGSSPPARNAAAGPANPSADPMAAMAGRLERVEAFGNVSVRTVTDNVMGDRGVYVPDTGVAHVGGNVRITRGMNQINGAEAVVNMKTGVATLLAGDSGRVTGLVIPNDQSNPPPDTGAKSKSGDQPKPGAKP